jgi:hypothetical protein
MKWILYVISILWVVFGACTVLYTAETRNTLNNLFKSFDLKILAWIPLVTGLLLVFSATASHYPWFIRLVGLMAVAKGVLIILNPNGMLEKINQWYINTASDQTYRLSGVIYIILGTAVFSWIL